VQTFLPYADFVQSASVLDDRRLGKQRAEVIQLLNGLDNPKDRVHRHPACIMWWGFKDALVAYGLAICSEWLDRGFKDSCYGKILAYKTVDFTPTQQSVPLPKWLGNEAFHASHRGNLLRKDYLYYSAFGWTDSPLLPYEWPRNCDPRLFL